MCGQSPSPILGSSVIWVCTDGRVQSWLVLEATCFLFYLGKKKSRARLEVSQNAAPPTIDMQKILKERIREPWKEISSERDREAVLRTSTDPRNLEAGCHHQMLSEMNKVL